MWVKKVFQNSMQNFAFREGPNNAHKLHAARIIADFAYVHQSEKLTFLFCFDLLLLLLLLHYPDQKCLFSDFIHVHCSGQNLANLASFYHRQFAH